MQNMYRLIGGDQSELEDFNVFGPGAPDESEAALDEIPSAASREQLEGAAAASVASAPGVAAGAAAGSKNSKEAFVTGNEKGEEAGGGKRGGVQGGQAASPSAPAAAKAAAAGNNQDKKPKKVNTANDCGSQRGKMAPPPEGMDKEEMRRLGLYAAFMFPLADSMCPKKKRTDVSHRI